jgi:hypothetical protein
MCQPSRLGRSSKWNHGGSGVQWPGARGGIPPSAPPAQKQPAHLRHAVERGEEVAVVVVLEAGGEGGDVRVGGELVPLRCWGLTVEGLWRLGLELFGSLGVGVWRLGVWWWGSASGGHCWVGKMGARWKLAGQLRLVWTEPTADSQVRARPSPSGTPAPAARAARQTPAGFGLRGTFGTHPGQLAASFGQRRPIPVKRGQTLGGAPSC